MGAKKWDNLSREEQQKLVLDLKLQHKHLQRAGKLEEAAALLTGLADRGAGLCSVAYACSIKMVWI